MPAETTQKLLSKKEVCVTRTIAITADNFSFISFPDLSGWRCQNGKCYLYVRDTVTWDWAQQRCRSRNATLVTISSSSENSFVASLIKTNIWIGLNDRVEAGTWDFGLHKPTCYIFKIPTCAYSHANRNFPMKWTTIQNACIWAIPKRNETKNLFRVLKRILYIWWHVI